ncbi:MAG TPA: ferrous iron transport protein B [Dehalococcoidales bacterium]|nr:ferrous iron transport protein B [Dehalococcoidales bacterium]
MKMRHRFGRRAGGQCHGTQERHRYGRGHGEHLTIALAGNANVGKTVIFNHLTGSDQITGNWPGKTVERAKGFTHHGDYDADIIDLPGIYSLSTFSMEEVVTREYIAQEKPDLIINVIGAPVLERNLFFTLQLLEMNVPMVVCVNQMDIAASKGITIDTEKLEKILGVPVLPAIAAKNQGINELKEKSFQIAEQQYKHRQQHKHEHGREAEAEPAIVHTTRYSDELEIKIEELTELISKEQTKLDYPPRWLAIKLLEGDSKVKESLETVSKSAVGAAAAMEKEIQEKQNQPAYVAFASERYALAAEITQSVQSQKALKTTFNDRLERLATGKITGYIAAFIVVGGLLIWTFTVGTALSNLLARFLGLFHSVNPVITGSFWSILGNGVYGGLVAGITLVIPYVIPFYLMLAVLEDSGILTRVAFMLDSAMHRMGLHGKAIIPIILGYGCNVPAIYATRIMGNRRERLLAAFAVTFSPCAARTIIIFGLVAKFMGLWWALSLYAIDILLMFVIVRIAVKAVPGETTGLIMEMHAFKTPSPTAIFKQVWSRTKSLIYMVFPIYIISSAAIQLAYVEGWLNPVNSGLSFLTVSWLGLPAAAGVLLIFGAARKELILLMAVTIFGANLAATFSHAQLFVLAMVGMIYPCFATIGALTKEFGWKSGWSIIGANMIAALLVSGITAKLWGWLS